MLKKLLVLVCSAVVLAGCTDPEVRVAKVASVVEPQPGVSAVVGPAGGRVVVPGGPVVDVPAGSVSGQGTLSLRKSQGAPVAPSPFLSIRDAYELKLEGAKLSGPIRLSFPVQMQPLPTSADEEAAAVLGRYEQGEWKIVPAQYDPDRKTIAAEVYEQAWWNAFVWDFSELRNAVATTYRSVLDVKAADPQCEHESAAQQAGVRVTAANSERISWCYGLDNGTAVLKVVNTQGYPVTVGFPRSWRMRQLRDGVQLPRALEALADQPGSALLSGGSTLELHPDALTPGGTVTARTSNAGFLALALALGFDAFERTSAGMPTQSTPVDPDLLTKLLKGNCLKRGRLDRPVESLAVAEESVRQAHSVAMRCLNQAWKADGFTTVARTWLTSGIDVLLDGVTGIPDGALYTQPAAIRVRATIPSTGLSS
ncbi:hypothetical protein [Kineosporia babensis]|uniref:Lipoprotein n=1 Tax=Kineosporia babensis TaxID=499548 RepID=A0A9X1SVX5_9ACTN|nr:hypothetical protein [Kineosporia babensis]MCD5313345.1 hypothetical protein [Kineosporia babensis]